LRYAELASWDEFVRRRGLAVDLQRLNLLEALRKLLPVVHDDGSIALLGEDLGHLLHLLLTLLNAVDTDISNKRNAGAHGGSGTTLAVLHRDSILVGDAKLLAGKVVDGGIGLAGRLLHGCSGAVDVLILEVVVYASLLDASDDTGLGRGADDGHGVALLLGPFQLLGNARAGLALLAQLGSDGSELAVNVGIDLLGGHGEAMLLLKAHEHATKVVADKVLQELIDGVSLRFAPLLEHLIGQIGAGFKGKAL
jgi:hypothetical protein